MKTRSGSMKTILLAILALGVAWKGSLYLLSIPPQAQESMSSSQPDPSSQVSKLAQAQQATASVPAAKSVAPQATQESAPIVSAKEAPTIDRVRKQVAANPHSTPPILIEFAAHMATVMEDAAKSRENARQAAVKLKDCVSNPDSGLIESARAMCLVNLERLAKGDSLIAKDYESAAADASPRVALIARATTSMGRR